MGAGLDTGIVQPDTTYNNTGSVKIADATIKNVLTYPLGQVSMTQVLEYSFNTGAVFVLQQLGGGEINRIAKQKLFEYFTDRYKLGETTGIELASEAKGKIIGPDDPNGGEVRYANMTFGQGINLSMLQVAAAFSAAVNGGTYYTPQIVDGYLDDGQKFTAKPPTVRRTGVLSADASNKLRSMLHQARAGSFIGAGDKPGYTIGGKTGTAQVYDAARGAYSESATIGSYLGYGGQDKPRYVIMVRVDDSTVGGFSGTVAAAPIFKELSNWMLEYLQIQPKG
jgi:cell division protein FtsI (penicillin-binding protein 3)